MIKSALQSSLTNDVKYNSMSVGNLPSSEYLITSTILSTQSEPSVTFDVSGLGNTYKHLRLVLVGRTTESQSGQGAQIRLRFNGDEGSNYRNHYLYGESSTMVSNTGSGSFIGLQRFTDSAATANAFGVMDIDIIDAFSANKNTTVRWLGGNANNSSFIFMNSGAWFNTAALTSIFLQPHVGGSFAIGSRFSLYGVV